MTNEEAQKVLDELQNVRPEVLNDEAKRLFEAIMKIADERDLAKKCLIENANVADERNQLLVENQKKDKIIQAIATNLVEHIGTCPIDYDDDFENEKCERCQNTYEECWIEYFTKKVGE